MHVVSLGTGCHATGAVYVCGTVSRKGVVLDCLECLCGEGVWVWLLWSTGASIPDGSRTALVSRVPSGLSGGMIVSVPQLKFQILTSEHWGFGPGCRH